MAFEWRRGSAQAGESNQSAVHHTPSEFGGQLLADIRPINLAIRLQLIMKINMLGDLVHCSKLGLRFNFYFLTL
jgi:hypothetical protein